MRRSTAKILTLLVVLAMIVALLVCEITGSHGAAFLIVLVGMMILAVLSLFFRCPNCGHLPRRGGLFDEYCSHCGEWLDVE